jgi:cytoskeletal protein RodZ
MLSVGQLLRKTRESKSLTLKQVEKEMRVREKFLEAIECDNWNIFSSKIYISGIIKNYAQYLGLDPKTMLAYFRRDYERQEEVKFKKRLASKYLHPETKRLAFLGVVFIFLIFFGYFGYQLKLYFSPPEITIVSPTTQKFRNVDRIKIVGKTDKESTVTIYNERVFQNKEGVFEYVFPMKTGSNTVTIEVIGANGKKAMLKKSYVLE